MIEARLRSGRITDDQGLATLADRGRARLADRPMGLSLACVTRDVAMLAARGLHRSGYDQPFWTTRIRAVKSDPLTCPKL